MEMSIKQDFLVCTLCIIMFPIALCLNNDIYFQMSEVWWIFLNYSSQLSDC